MQKLIIGLAAVLLATSSAGVIAQDSGAERASVSNPDCNYVCVFSTSVDELWKVDPNPSQPVEPQIERERRASYRSTISDNGVELLSAMARQAHER